MTQKDNGAKKQPASKLQKDNYSTRRHELGSEISDLLRSLRKEGDDAARAARIAEIGQLPEYQGLSEADRERAILEDAKIIEESTSGAAQPALDVVAEPARARGAIPPKALQMSEAVAVIDATSTSAGTADKPTQPAKSSQSIRPEVRSLIDEADALYARDPEKETRLFQTKIYAQRVELTILVNAGLDTDEAFAAYCKERDVKVERRTAEKRFHTVTKGLWPREDRERKKSRISEEADYARAVVEVGGIVPEKGRVVDWINTPGLPSGQDGKGKTGLQKLKAFRLALPDVQAKEEKKSAEQVEQEQKYVAERIANGPTFGEFKLGEADFKKLKSFEAERQEDNPDDDEDVNGLSLAVLHWDGNGKFRVGELITRDPIRVARIHKKERG